MRVIKSLTLVVLGVAPLVTFAFTVPSHDARVTDLADIFSESEEAGLETKLQNIETVYQAEIAVVTLPSLEGGAIEEVTIQIAEERGVGKEQTDNGIVVAIAPTERAWRIEVGYGLEGALPDITAGTLGRNILVPAFQAGDYFGGVNELVEVLSGVVSGEFDPTLVEDEATAEATMIEKFWIGLMMVAFLSFFLSMFTKGVVESRKKKPTDKQKQTISGRGSSATTLLGVLMVGALGVVYLLPAYLIWKMIMSASGSSWKTPTGGGRSSGGWGGGGGGSFGGGFGGFGGGSFGGGGAGGRR